MTATLTQAHAHWLVSDKRKELLWAIQQALASHLAFVIPDGGLVGLLATECAALALERVDAALAEPIQAQANVIAVIDYRKD